MFYVGLIVCLLAVEGRAPVRAQEATAPQRIPPEQLQSLIDNLGDLDYTTRTAASRAVRRSPAAQAVPALMRAVSDHTDGYVRYRALVLLTGFNDPRTTDAMRASLTSPNDRLRAVAYSFFEHHPNRLMIPTLVAALDREQGEFVRPELVRALAAQGGDLRVQRALLREVGRGADYFRSAVIEALGDYKALYAFDALTAIAKLDGPLQDDAALALGKIGAKPALETLANLQRTAPRGSQPSIAAAVCLLGINCEAHQNYLAETLRFADRNPGFQELLRGAASALSTLAVAGHTDALEPLFRIGLPSRENSTRAPIALALGTVALRNTPLMLATLSKRPDRAQAVELLSEGFDMLEEDLDKETFFATVRRRYWESPPNSPARELMQALIGKLEF
jgi:HEAT repeat protein